MNLVYLSLDEEIDGLVECLIILVLSCEFINHGANDVGPSLSLLLIMCLVDSVKLGVSARASDSISTKGQL